MTTAVLFAIQLPPLLQADDGQPARASAKANTAPDNPAPTITTSASSVMLAPHT